MFLIKTLIFLISLATLGTSARVRQQTKTYRESGAVKILHSRGYVTKDHYIKVQDGEVTLNVVRATNPLINSGQSGLDDKAPLLFIHGILNSANSFILSHQDVSPRDHSGLNLDGMSVEELIESLETDPASNSLVFTALNFGYEVWLLNRRSTVDTQAANGIFERDYDHEINEDADMNYYDYSDDFDRDVTFVNHTVRTNYLKYWNFSLDEQAKYDVPETIDYVLKQTNKEKLVVVGFSAGAALTLMALTHEPKLAQKISKTLLWAPSLDLGSKSPSSIVRAMMFELPLVVRTIGFQPSKEVRRVQEENIYLACRGAILRPFLCYTLLNSFAGSGSSQLMVEKLIPGVDWIQPTSHFEGSQLLQSIRDKTMHYYDFMDPLKNKIAYGTVKSPEYNISHITLDKIHIWAGNTDSLVSYGDVDSTERRLKVPVKRHNIGGPGIFFNHAAFLIHLDIQKHLIIPSLKAIGSQ